MFEASEGYIEEEERFHLEKKGDTVGGNVGTREGEPLKGIG